MYKNRILQTLLVTTLFCASSLAMAGSVYNVGSTSKINCSSDGVAAPHGLWTNQYRKGPGGGCKQFYDFQEGSSLEIEGDKAFLSATAKNPYDVTAKIDFVFENATPGTEWTDTIKNPGLGDPDDWTFYGLGAGDIEINYETSILGVTYRVTDNFTLDLVDTTAFQFGVGANDKTPVLGASGWLDIGTWVRTRVVELWDGTTFAKIRNYDPTLFDDKLGSHWDLNMELSAVPLPAAAWLFFSGLLGLFGYNRHTKKQAAAAA